MQLQQNVPLADYTTMRIGGPARYFTQVSTKEELTEALYHARTHKLPVKVVGGGSNIIFSDKGFPGLVIHNAIGGLNFQAGTVTAGAGVVWDDIVQNAVGRELSGVEALSRIPGSAGAAPVQNIGAYGQELSESFLELEAYDSKKQRFVTLGKKDSGFGYRTSVLKKRPELIVTGITLELSPEPPRIPEYRDVTAYFRDHRAKETGVGEIRKVVSAIRARKLPDPSVVPNCGSFFHNPVLSPEQFKRLEAGHPEINDTPEGWPQPPRWLLPDDFVKISAAWLLEQAGLRRGGDICGLKLWENQALVLTNPNARGWNDLQCAISTVREKVAEAFGISLTPEPELVGQKTY
jgi:UDP-N-acetylmuramate dehydrogenase